ncbi:hypothetical protein CXG81DRAFT_11221 [Caulochytrium protostelioides]|uniref:T-complex protein 1 subunit alpha n=1 Tax=Caulochytrium protostelioides TaxID=1555241 RepID=A0A4P9X9V9_9FUNG|nr:hypothetical protein CXG81DRAFT_11221 [Caulochytrium protostelioides]|eukprot:RKP02092.1 hypothetical protein CXG81DRAFT_11221 [Caulochytrium protostelioides]
MSQEGPNPRKNNPLLIGGSRTSGAEVRNQNVLAASSIANIVKSSLGPVGLDKMLVDDIGDVTISNDGATILKMLDVEHPAARVLVELAQQQDKEVGDGTTSVVIIAAELLRRANDLVKNKIHPTTLINGYRLASKEATKYIVDHLAIKLDQLPKDALINVAKTSMSSKIIGADDAFFASMCVDALTTVKTTNAKGEAVYPVKAVNILKAHGKSVKESLFIRGYALNCTVAAQAIRTNVTNCKIACLDMNLMKARMGLGVNIVIDDPDQLEAIRRRESDITTERIKKILATGANVVLTTKGIDDMCLKLFVEANCMAVRRVNKDDMKRIAKATGATMLSTLSNLEGEEVFDASCLGQAESMTQERISDDELIIMRGAKHQASSSIILRGANDFMLDEMDRSIHDALCAVKRTLESSAVVPGGGAVEAALSVYLETFATTLASREQLAIAEYAQALLVIPKTLAVNAAKDATDLVARMRAYHHQAQTLAGAEDTAMTGAGATAGAHALQYTGLDLIRGTLVDNVSRGVLEPAMSKLKSLKAATEAAIALLRIDDMITIAPEQQQDDGHGH